MTVRHLGWSALSFLGFICSVSIREIHAGRFSPTLYFNGSLLDESINYIPGYEGIFDVPDLGPSATPPMVSAPAEESTTSDRLAEESTTPPAACPPMMVRPVNRTFTIGCVPLFPDVSYVPPGFFVGNVTVDGPGNWSITQKNASNFDVDSNGTITVGGFLLGDGFRGVVTVVISDTSGMCDQVTVTDFTVHISCYPNQTSTTTPPVESQTRPDVAFRQAELDSQWRTQYQIPAGVDLG